MEYLALIIAVMALVGVIFIKVENKKEFEQIEKAFNHRKSVDNGLSDRIREARLDFSKLVEDFRKSKDSDIASLQKQIDKLHFMMQNPLKYKVGDKAPDKGWVVTKAEVVEQGVFGISGNITIYTNTGNVLMNNSCPHTPFINQYTSTNIKTGETKTWEE